MNEEKKEIIYKFQVRDLREEATTRKFTCREHAVKWYAHLFEVRPNSRCVIEDIYETKETE